jgi:pimeloyl-ACP methyl ester carboxylesterase
MAGRGEEVAVRRRWGLALALAAAGAAAGGLAAQHRAARRARGEAGVGAEQLELPADLVHHEVRTDDGATLHVVERGRGPAMLLLHGMLLTSAIWVHQLTDLADRHRVVALDLRGHGRSAGGGRPLRLDTLADDVERVVEALGLSGCLLVGHSLGGMVALQVAQQLGAERQGRFCGVALVSSAAGPFVKVPGWGPLLAAATPAWSRLGRLAERADVWASPVRDLRWWSVRLAFGAEAVPAQVRFVESMQAACSTATLVELLPVVAGLDLSARLAQVDLPVLVVAGTHDRLVPPRLARRTAHGLPQGQLVELPRCGHMPMLERRREFSRLLDEFCAKVG